MPRQKSSDFTSLVLFDSFEDYGYEYKMKKIRLNEETFLRFARSLSSYEKIQVIGVFGCFYQALKIAQKHLGEILSCTFSDVEEGIIFFKKMDKVVAVYKCLDP